MLGLRTIHTFLMAGMFACLSFCADTNAQQTNVVGLPQVKENYGLENPPDLPDVPSVTVVPETSAPALNGGQVNLIPPAGGLLSTLDNLPPVGVSGNNPAARTYTPQLPEPVRNQQNQGRATRIGNLGQATDQPKIVRFGDVRNESEARKQFPELVQAERGGASANDRPITGLPETKPPTGLAKYNPLRLLNRFNPMRLDKPEPPLVQKAVGPGDALVEDDASGQINRSDRTDSEIQKRVDRIIREEFGTKTNDFTVEVINREVFIKARPNWFWQKRQLSEDLQRLPGIDSKRLHITVY